MHIKTLNDENDFSILTNSPAVDLRVDSDIIYFKQQPMLTL